MKSLKEALIKKHTPFEGFWPNPYNISAKDCIDCIDGFPVEVVTLAMNCVEKLRPGIDPLRQLQELGLNCAFEWILTPEGHDFWNIIQHKKDFSIFYKVYNPKTLEKRLAAKWNP